MTRAEIIALQRDLAARGYPLKADGIYGPKTAEAYQDWLNQHTPQDVITPAPAAAKPWWTSRAILGLLATVLAMLAGHFGLEIDDATSRRFCCKWLNSVDWWSRPGARSPARRRLIRPLLLGFMASLSACQAPIHCQPTARPINSQAPLDIDSYLYGIKCQEVLK